MIFAPFFAACSVKASAFFRFSAGLAEHACCKRPRVTFIADKFLIKPDDRVHQRTPRHANYKKSRSIPERRTLANKALTNHILIVKECSRLQYTPHSNL